MNFTFNATVLSVVICLIAVFTSDDLTTERKSAAVAVLFAYSWILWTYHKAKQRRAGGSNRPSDYLIAFASETGTARSIATQTAKRLKNAGAASSVVELGDLASAIPPSKALLVIASTTGNGDPPKNAANWLGSDKVLLPYHAISFAVLALGDRSYSRFCQFGVDVTVALQNAGAISLFDTQLVDNANPDSIAYWHQLVENAHSKMTTVGTNAPSFGKA